MLILLHKMHLLSSLYKMYLLSSLHLLCSSDLDNFCKLDFRVPNNNLAHMHYTIVINLDNSTIVCKNCNALKKLNSALLLNLCMSLLFADLSSVTCFIKWLNLNWMTVHSVSTSDRRHYRWHSTQSHCTNTHTRIHGQAQTHTHTHTH